MESKKRQFIAAMESVFGLVGNGFAVVAAGAPAVVGGGGMLSLLDGKNDRAFRLNSHTLLAASGRAADCELFKSAMQENASGDTAAVAGVAHVAVRACAFAVEAMVAGYDEGGGGGASIYSVGPTSPLRRVESGALGCGASLCAGVMERHYRTGMTVGEAVAVVDKCIRELRRLGGVSFVIKIVDKDGVREYARRTHIKKSGRND